MIRLLAALFLLNGVIAHAQSFPTKPMRIIVPYSPGGLLDRTARNIAASLALEYGQPVVVENRTGAQSAVAINALKQAPADGHTLLLDNSGVIIRPILKPKNSFKVGRDLQVVSIVTGSTSLLAINAAVPARNLKELVALARKSPGTLNYSSAGVGTILHMSGELLKSLAGIDIVHVPYKGGSAAMADVVSGRIQIIFLGSSILEPFIKSGRVRAIASTGTQRANGYPDLPTIAESGYPEFNIVSWIGLFVVQSTPPELVTRLGQGLVAIQARPEFRTALARSKLDGLGLVGEAAQKMLDAEERTWVSVIRKNNIKLE